jgi:hypothetical protein
MWLGRMWSGSAGAGRGRRCYFWYIIDGRIAHLISPLSSDNRAENTTYKSIYNLQRPAPCPEAKHSVTRVSSFTFPSQQDDQASRHMSVLPEPDTPPRKGWLRAQRIHPSHRSPFINLHRSFVVHGRSGELPVTLTGPDRTVIQ